MGKTGDVLLSQVTRSGVAESVHHGSLVVVEAGRTVLELGATDQAIWCRSAVKPFQSLPLVESGAAERFGLEAKELAVVTASHEGTAEHLALVRSVLAKGGFSPGDLRCGPHAPYDADARRELVRGDLSPTPMHNNCSGKHAGFLLLARHLGVPTETYLELESPVQDLSRRAIADMAELPVDALGLGLDGCGAVTFAMPLSALARAFSRFAAPGLAEARREACARIHAAVVKEPHAYSGRRHFCKALIEASGGKILPKNGAEGVYALAVPSRGLGLAVKIADGNERGYFPVVVEALRRLGVLEPGPELEAFWHAPVLNTQGRRVGEATAVF